MLRGITAALAASNRENEDDHPKKSDYNELQAQNQQLQSQNQQLQQQLAESQQRAGRLQGAIKYTIESDLLFGPGS